MANNTSNISCVYIQELYPDLVDKTKNRIWISLLYGLTFALGITGNATVLVLWFKSKVTFHVRRPLVFSLTMADAQILCFAIPANCVQSMTRVWVFGPIACHTLPYLQSAATLATSFTLATIAVDRYLTVKYPHGSFMNDQIATIATVCIWMFALFWSAPYGVFMDLGEAFNFCGKFCDEKWPKETGPLHKIYAVLTVCLQFLLPVVSFGYCFTFISKNVTDQVNKRILTSKYLSQQSKSSLLNRKRSVNRMLLVMMTAFMVAWLPMNIMAIYRDVDPFFETIPPDYINTIYTLALLSGMTSSIWNPIIYSLWIKEFRDAIRKFAIAKSNQRTKCISENTSHIPANTRIELERPKVIADSDHDKLLNTAPLYSESNDCFL